MMNIKASDTNTRHSYTQVFKNRDKKTLASILDN